MTELELIAIQRETEQTYSKHNIHKVVKEEIENDSDLVPLVKQAAELIEQWWDGDYYESKNKRLAELKSSRNAYDLALEIAIITIQVTRPMLFTSVVGTVTGVLGMTNKIDGTKTAAELLAVVADVDLYDVFKEGKYESMQLVSRYVLSDETTHFISNTKYLPPMLVAPNEVTRNFDCDYLTRKSSMILGKGNHHEGDICLDTINLFNQIPLSLNVELLTALSESPKRQITDPEQREQWTKFVRDSYEVYKQLIQAGNRIWLTHKVDKRGRTYSQGYHVNTQGNQFRKAMLEFADKEVISL